MSFRRELSGRSECCHRLEPWEGSDADRHAWVQVVCRVGENVTVPISPSGDEIGGDDGIRTHDLLSAIQALVRAELRPHLRGGLSYQKGEPLQEVRRAGVPGKGLGLEDGSDHGPGGDLGGKSPHQTQFRPSNRFS